MFDYKHPDYPKPMLLKYIAIWICEPCLEGQGEQCYTPSCALFLHSVDLPLHPALYTVLDYRYEDDDD